LQLSFDKQQPPRKDTPMAKYKKRKRQTTTSVTPLQLGAAVPVVRQTLDDHVRQAIQEKLPELLELEVQEYLGRQRYEHQRPGVAKQYRNGYAQERCLTCGCGSIGVRVPRLRERYESHIVGRYQRMSGEVKATLPELYLHGLSTGDFSQCLHLLLGADAPLSGSTIVRLKKSWKHDYEQWRERKLDAEYLYVWVDGVYPKAGPVDERTALLVVIGLNRKGEKEVLAIEEGPKESADSWRDLLRQLKRCGVQWIGLVIADGIDAIWKALRDVFPPTRQQRCWIHKMRNVLDKVPQSAHDEVKGALDAIYRATAREKAFSAKERFIRLYRERFPKAVASLEEAGDRLFSYFDFPSLHWKSIKSTNVIESIFATVKLRTDATRRIRKQESATYLVFKLLVTAERRLNRIRGYKLVPETIDTCKAQRKLKQTPLRIAA
jgi:putative transposase